MGNFSDAISIFDEGTVMRKAMYLTVCLFVVGGLAGCLATLATVTGQKDRGWRLPVGYDDPRSPEGGPWVGEGLGWVETVWPRTIKFTDNRDGIPSVLFMSGPHGMTTLHELNRRYPIDATFHHVEGHHCHVYDRVVLEGQLAAKKYDVYVLAGIKTADLPRDLLYIVLQRVKEEGAGLIVFDRFHYCDILQPKVLNVKNAVKGPTLLKGIPYSGFRQYSNSGKDFFPVLNYWWSRQYIHHTPAVSGYAYKEFESGRFGKGTVVWVDSGTAHGWIRPMLPGISMSRDMWVENDYHYSVAAKLMQYAAGKIPTVEIERITPEGKTDGATVPEVTLKINAGSGFSGKLRWQIRDTWGIVTDEGAEPVVIGEGGRIRLANAVAKNAGRNFLDLWLVAPDGGIVDWGSAFVEVERGIDAPVIRPDHPDGTPYDKPLSGSVSVANAPENAKLRLTLVDRHFRDAASIVGPAGAPVTYSFDRAALDGQIWTLKADVIADDGDILARSFATVTAPFGRDELGGFRPTATFARSAATPEGAGWAEYARRIGFVADRLYSGGNPVDAEAMAFCDVQLRPYVQDIREASDDYASDRYVDYEDPDVLRQLAAAYTLSISTLRKFGLRGYNQTDDSSYTKVLPYGPYTQRMFHEWLAKKYGSYEALCKAWQWTPDKVALSPDGLPADAYVTLEFHEWLKRKYGGKIAAVGKAWGMKPDGFGVLDAFGWIHRKTIEIAAGKNLKVPAADARAFMQEYLAKKPAENPWGRINPESISAAFAQGKDAPWIEMQYFLSLRWSERLMWAHAVAEKLGADIDIGSDAAFYEAAQYDVFGTQNYLAPYYRDQVVKEAVSRGRMQRPGDYGACIGTYGERPANLATRRNQPWAILFAGGNSLYFWFLRSPLGFSPELKLNDKHAKYQCEQIEEITSGIGEQFTRSERIFDRIAVLNSKHSHLCDQLEKKGQPITSVENSVTAFGAVIEDLGLNPHYIDEKDLAAGWLDAHKTRLLALCGANSLDDRTVGIVRAFVENGGVVVSDSRPATRNEAGLPRAAGALDDVFGITLDRKIETARVQGILRAAVGGTEYDFGEALADPRIRAGTAVPSGKLSDAECIFTNDFGKGKAILFNASFNSYVSYRAEGGVIWRPWYEVMKTVVGLAGEKRLFVATSEGKETPGLEFSPFVSGKGYLLGVEDLGCGDFIGEVRPFDVKLPGKFHLYESRQGRYLGHGDVLRDKIPRNGHRAYTLSPEKIVGVAVSASPAVAAPGKPITLTVGIETDNGAPGMPHAVRVEVFDPDGEYVYAYRRIGIVPAGEKLALKFYPAFNDKTGDWTFKVTDVVSGKTASARFGLPKGDD